MGIFASRDENVVGSNIDEFLNQRILTPKVFLSPVDGEQYIRVYGQTKYADTRSSLVQQALAEQKPFWQGKVFLELGLNEDEGGVAKKVFYIRTGKLVIGEISEFDRRAQEVLDFESGAGYVARAVLQDDLIGCLVQLFVDSDNRI